MTLADKINLVCILALSLLCLSLCASVKRLIDDIHDLDKQVNFWEERLRSERNYSEIMLRAFQNTQDKLKTCETK